MTLLQLEYFQEVVKSGSIAKAAEILGISRSALSITLERLETDLGYPLFERKNKDIVITPNEKKVLHYSYKILHTMEDIQQDFLERRGMENKKKITVGVTDNNYYGDWVLDLLEQYPELKLNLRHMSREEIYDNLLTGNLDFGISNSVEYRNQLDSQLLFCQPYQLLVLRDHPLALKKSITIEELAKEPLISLPPSHKDRMIDTLCLDIHFQPNIVFEGDSDIMEEMFHSGIGSILTCAHNRNQWMKLGDANYTVLDIEGVTARYEMHLIWSKFRYLSKCARIFKNYVLNYYHV